MNKGVVIVLVVFFVLAFIIGSYILINTKNNPEDSCAKIENGYCILKDVPEYLKFQEPVAIDEHELYNFSKSPFPDYFIKNPDDSVKGYLCTETNNPPKLINYFLKNYDETSTHYRYAVICDSFYVVEDHDALGYGRTMYGPYEL